MLTKGSLRSRLTVSFLALTTLSLFFLGGYLLWFFYQHNMTTLQTTLLNQGKIVEQLLLDNMANARSKAEIDEKIKQLGMQLALRITVIDPQGSVLADSEANPALMENHSDRPEVREAMAGRNGFNLRPSTTQGETLLYVSTPMHNGEEIIGIVRLATSLAHIDQGFVRITAALIFALLITAGLCIIVSILLARNYTAPLEYIIATSRQIADGQLDKRVFVRTGDELELLAHALNHLTSSLEDKINDADAKTRKLELILTHMDNAVILFDRYGRVTTANKKAVEIFCITEAMLGLHSIEVIGNSLLVEAVQETIHTGQNKSVDLKTNINGSKKVFQVSVAPISDSGSEITGALSVFHDITALQEIHERQADFVANASHELSTPLTTIKGFSETLLDGAMEEPALREKFIRIIHTEAERMHRLIQELLQLAKLNSQEYRRQIQLEALDIRPILDFVKQDLTPRWQGKNLDVTICCDDAAICTIAHRDWLKQVLTNLLENSIKYTPANGKIVLSGHKYLDTLQKEWIKITVQDSGIGIPASDLPLIFDRFYRVERARTRTTGGTGLGLAIAKFIVEILGGSIEVSSTLDSGSTFTVLLPAAPTE